MKDVLIRADKLQTMKSPPVHTAVQIQIGSTGRHQNMTTFMDASTGHRLLDLPRHARCLGFISPRCRVPQGLCHRPASLVTDKAPQMPTNPGTRCCAKRPLSRALPAAQTLWAQRCQCLVCKHLRVHPLLSLPGRDANGCPRRVSGSSFLSL
ncbi:hypothetical protein NDU88_000615 [Pleurodeles waltl]|uniref:Uncharacterized protein n=1 Tax=Pleurodeles waltl TaxID=8319 RepID=A0AAV7L940_PLEWA|nr:hypothetical protein NDU88_000615 [Pleurodeles waltl]